MAETDIAASFSKSEDVGIGLLPADAKQIYSVGISTGGIAEMRMAGLLPDAHIIATTIDEKGVAFATELIKEKGLDQQIEVKLEDVAKPLPYEDGHFDYIYARLVLHYLSKDDLATTLTELCRVLRSGGKLFVVVRSVECDDAKREGATYDPETCLTTCRVTNPDGSTYSYTRYFHTEESISAALEEAGFAVESVESYDEQLFVDFMRTELADHLDNVVQVVASK
ncbi:MAG TPA: methyltransferase domain-containing protein [Candidatus Saccharimonadales bacterium]|nr:methyltransferase domain-containing protein [Candidatus Saccharimonadales bacterium]